MRCRSLWRTPRAWRGSGCSRAAVLLRRHQCGTHRAPLHGRCPGRRRFDPRCERLASIRLIDATENLRRMRAWLLAARSTPRCPSVVRSGAEFFAHYTRQHAVQGRARPGARLADAVAVACNTSDVPFLNRCGVDRVGEMLNALHPAYPPARPARDACSSSRRRSSSRRGGAGGRCPRWRVPAMPTFRRNARRRALPRPRRAAWLPPGATQIKQVFVRDAGYNGWAAAHDTIVLYPQVQPSQPTMVSWWQPFNPNGAGLVGLHRHGLRGQDRRPGEGRSSRWSTAWRSRAEAGPRSGRAGHGCRSIRGRRLAAFRCGGDAASSVHLGVGELHDTRPLLGFRPDERGELIRRVAGRDPRPARRSARARRLRQRLRDIRLDLVDDSARCASRCKQPNHELASKPFSPAASRSSARPAAPANACAE